MAGRQLRATVHFLVLLWSIADLLPEPMWWSVDSEEPIHLCSLARDFLQPPCQILLQGIALYIEGSFLAGVIFGGYLLVMPTKFGNNMKNGVIRISGMIIQQLLFRAGTLAFVSFLICVIWAKFGFKNIFTDLTVLVCIIAPVALWANYCEVFCITFPRVVQTLLISTERDFLEEGEPWSFLIFVYTLVLSLFWYAFKYDPEGTVNPSWTGIFG